MLHIALFEPEIPPNTGNIIRLCANTGAQLHLIEPLGFVLDDKRLRRAGLDYHEFADVQQYPDYAHFLDWANPRRIFACTTKARQHYHQVHFQDEDILLLGPESRGLPASILDSLDDNHKIRIPMLPDSRSLNLSNAAAILLYHAWQDIDFAGAVSPTI